MYFLFLTISLCLRKKIINYIPQTFYSPLRMKFSILGFLIELESRKCIINDSICENQMFDDLENVISLDEVGKLKEFFEMMKDFESYASGDIPEYGSIQKSSYFKNNLVHLTAVFDESMQNFKTYILIAKIRGDDHKLSKDSIYRSNFVTILDNIFKEMEKPLRKIEKIIMQHLFIYEEEK